MPRCICHLPNLILRKMTFSNIYKFLNNTLNTEIIPNDEDIYTINKIVSLKKRGDYKSRFQVSKKFNIL